MINQSIATDKRLNSLSVEAHLVYLMTIPHLDRDGLILGEPSMLFSEVCRRRPELLGQMTSIIEEWLFQELVIQYDGKEDPILFFVGFTKNQAGMRYEREAPSQFPIPPGFKRTDIGLKPDEEYRPLPPSDKAPDELRSNSGGTPPQCNVKEENVIGGGVPPTNTRTRRDVTNERAAKYMNREYTGIAPKLLTKLTNHIKAIYGYSALIDKAGSDSLEDELRGVAYELWKLGFNSDEDMIDLRNSWNNYAIHFTNKRPGKDQLYKLAITMISSTPVATANGVLNFSLEDLV